MSRRDRGAKVSGVRAGLAARLRSSTLLPALAGSALVWASLPPVDAWPLAWIAPVPWILLIRRQSPLPGRRPYLGLWLAGAAFWLGALHWLRLPHWATSFGWVALSLYLAVYLPLLVALGRVAVHRLGISVVLAAPVVFVGLELARAHVLTGFRMAALGHTQYRWIELIQVADLAGDFGVDFLVMLVAACAGRMIPMEPRRWSLWPLLPAGAAVAAALVYGHFRIAAEDFRPGPRVALIQGSIDTELKFDVRREQEVHSHYFALTRKALRTYSNLDLIIWPETMYRIPLVIAEGGAGVPSDWTRSPGEFASLLSESAAASADNLRRTARAFGVPTVLGVDTMRYGRDRLHRYNSAVFLDKQGNLLERYDKVHPVMFGEYVPLADEFPWLARFTPLQSSLDHGAEAVAFKLGEVVLAPNICYETVLSHLIRDQVNRLAAKGQSPDVLVNLTNDGWFWGSSELDMHLACGVFRAIECRRPVLIAANTGFSGSIDSSGRIIERGPRRDAAILLAEPRLDRRRSPYLGYGDVPAGVCLAACGVLAAWGVGCRFRERSANGLRAGSRL